jgi:hypothetical protein
MLTMHTIHFTLIYPARMSLYPLLPNPPGELLYNKIKVRRVTMTNQNPNKITVKSGAFNEILVRAKLVLHLMADRRVNLFLKVLPIASVIYVLNPIDVPGPFDDIAIFSLGLYAFVELCPPGVVQEHLDRMHGINPDVAAHDEPDENVIEGEFKEVHTSSDDQESK